MLALDPRVMEAIWQAVAGLVPRREPPPHPLGCHRRRIEDRVCFRGMVIRLVTGCSWDVASRVCGVGETTLRRRRDEWLRAGVFAALVREALEAYDKAVGLGLDEVAIDASQHKAPMGGAGTGKNGADRGKLGWKWSVAVDRNGVPLAWTVTGANRHDSTLFEDTLGALDERGYEVELECVHLDRGYDYLAVRRSLAEAGIDAEIPRRRQGRKGRHRPRLRSALGPRWPVERTNSWFTNFGQLRRNTDRKPVHREAAMDLAVAFILAAKLVMWRKRYGPVFAAA